MILPALRRVWLPWLLLLVPTLLIGAVALRLLWQEQRRIDEAGTEAVARAAAVTRERAQVAADNIELLVAEIRDGLMRELAETPSSDLDALLANWPRTNLLVAQTFLWKPNGGGLAWPPADTAEHLVFRSRHADLFRGSVARLAAQSEQAGRSQPAQAKDVATAKPLETQQVTFVPPAMVPTEANGVDDAVPATSLAGMPPPATEETMPPLDELIVMRPTEFAAEDADTLAQFTSNTQVLQNRTIRRDIQQATKASADLARNSPYPAAAKKGRSSSSGRELAAAPSSVAAASTSLYKLRAAPETEERSRQALEESAVVKLKMEAEQARWAEEAAEVEKELSAEVALRPEAARPEAAAPAEIAATVTHASVGASRPAGLVVADADKADHLSRGTVATPSVQPAPAPVVIDPVSVPEGAEAETPRAPWGAPASGWLGRTVDGAVYFLGWWQPAGGGAVRGVELNLPAVLERVQALVPAAAADGERFALRGPGETIEDTGFRIPLATTLPGWTLVAWSGAPRLEKSLERGGGFFVVAALLVGAFVAAIVAGGAIFFRQAAAASHEAALKTSFVSNVSHEMKTPLTTIRMYAEMLADERVDDPAKRQRYFATIGRETTRLTRLVNNALDFGRLEAGRKEYRPESITLAPWLVRLAEVHGPRVAEAGIQLSVTKPADVAAVRCDPDSLDQMVLNLVDNAVKYAAAGGLVELRVEAVNGGWALVVADRGPGVPAAQCERIFERFHRVDEALTAKAQGAGLGLTIARRLARDQRGNLHCRERSGGGAEFVLTLPAAEMT